MPDAPVITSLPFHSSGKRTTTRRVVICNCWRWCGSRAESSRYLESGILHWDCRSPSRSACPILGIGSCPVSCVPSVVRSAGTPPLGTRPQEPGTFASPHGRGPRRSSSWRALLLRACWVRVSPPQLASANASRGITVRKRMRGIMAHLILDPAGKPSCACTQTLTCSSVARTNCTVAAPRFITAGLEW